MSYVDIGALRAATDCCESWMFPAPVEKLKTAVSKRRVEKIAVDRVLEWWRGRRVATRSPVDYRFTILPGPNGWMR
jgi:hypothetical protein